LEGVEAGALQHLVANVVMFGLVFVKVPAAIGFDDEAGFEADKI